MDFLEKAKIRMEHWIGHNDQHQEEYENFARELEKAGKKKSAEYIREMIELTAKTADCLSNAVKALEQEKGQ
jgi:predicted DNA-binding protein